VSVVALDGAGSPGKETGYFGEATRKALKKFQALFIEYIGVADGALNQKTRVVLQAICEKNRTKKEQNIAALQKLPATTFVPSVSGNLQISLQKNVSSVVPGGEFKISLTANSDLNQITPESVIVDGGSLKDIRKISKREFSLVVRAEENSKLVSVQVEADAIKDASGLTNKNASNEILVNVKTETILGAVGDSISSVGNTVEDLLNGIVSGTSPSVDTNSDYYDEGYSPGGGLSQIGGGSYGGAQKGGLSGMLNSLFGGTKNNSGQDQSDNNLSTELDSGGWDETQDTMENTRDIEIPKDIDPMCIPNYGINPGGSCPNLSRLTATVKRTTMQACTIIKKRINSQSQYRTKECNTRVGGASASSHMSGMALDINVNNLSSSERSAVFLVFKKNGFDNIGCYRRGSGNVHLDHRGGGPRRWGPNFSRTSYNPANCPTELIQVFGR
jgi:hypothetical protein